MDVLDNKNAVLVLRDRYRPFFAILWGCLLSANGFYMGLVVAERAELRCERNSDRVPICIIERQTLAKTQTIAIGEPSGSTILRTHSGRSGSHYWVAVQTTSGGTHRIAGQEFSNSSRTESQRQQAQIEQFRRTASQDSLSIVIDSRGWTYLASGAFLGAGLVFASFLGCYTLYYFDPSHNRLVVERHRWGRKQRQNYPLHSVSSIEYETKTTIKRQTLVRTSIYLHDGQRLGGRWHNDFLIGQKQKEAVATARLFLGFTLPYS